MSTLRVVEPFACDVKGLPRVYRAGDLVDAKDPVVKGREKFFADVEVFAQRSANMFEEATAAPNQPRARTRAARGGKKGGDTPNQPAPESPADDATSTAGE